jgi:hypothetical protein
MSATVDKQAAWEEFAQFVRGRPESVQALMRDWPPTAIVRTRPGVTLLVPAPDVDGTVVSYFENGRLGVAAPITIPHPEHGFGAATPGEMAKAECSPDQLQLVREPLWTRDDVALALASTSSA